MTTPRFRSFAEALSSAGPAADRADKMSLYGWLIGDWRFAAVVHADEGARHTGEGEIHFAWVLEGRAIQDVWILPGIFFGTTRWSFTEITPDGFRWTGERSLDGGATWQLQADFRARRADG